MIFFPLTGLMTLFCILTLVGSGVVHLLKGVGRFEEQRVENITVKYVFLSLCTISIVFLLALSTAVYVLRPSFEAIAVYAETQNVGGMEICPTQSPHPLGNSVIFRFDDVSPHFHNEATFAVLKAAETESIPLVLGVIPAELGTDIALLKTLRNLRCTHEIASHGYTHNRYTRGGVVYAEFEGRTKTEAQQLYASSNALFQEYLSLTPTTFIPPEGKVSKEAERVARLENFTIVSDNDTDFYDLDADIWNTKMGTVYTAEEVIQQCNEAFTNNDELCVIVLHPQDFIDRNGILLQARVDELQKIFHHYSQNQYTVTTFQGHQVSTKLLRAQIR